MKIAFNPSTVAALTTPPNNKDITFDLRGRNIFARGVKFQGTDTWRDIKINNVSIDSNILDLRNGSNTTLTNTNGVVTINSTWRPVVDNLTSDSTTSSLSANQGRVLKALIDGKSNSGHNHDDRYLKLTGGTLTGNLIGTAAMFSGRFYGNGDDEGIIVKPSSNGYAGLILGTHNGERSVFYLTKGNPFWRYNNGSTNLDIQHPKKPGVIALTSDIPSSLKNPYSLTTFGVVYDGSAAKVVSPSNFISQVNEATSTVTDGTMFITSYASNNGFADTNAVNVPYKRKAIHLWEYIKTKTDSLYATKGHNHDDRYLKLTGGTMSGTIYRNSGGSTISGRDHAIIRQTYAPGGSSWNPIACVDTETGTWTLGHLSSGDSDTNFHFCFSTNTDYNAGNNNGNYVTLRNKVGTIALLSDIPSSLKNPHALTISLNGTSQGPYDGSAAKNINITPGSIGAAVSNHSHDYLVVNAADDKSFNSAYHNFQVLYAAGGNGITGRPPGVEAFGLIKLRAAQGYSGQILLANGGSLYIRSSEDAKMTNTLAWKTILDSSNYSGILDSRYYTESEVNNLLSKKLNTSDFNWTNLPGKLVAGNEFNIVNSGFEAGMWFNYLPINDRSKTATITGYHFGNGATGYTSIKASGFIKNGSSSSYVLLGDGGHKAESSLRVAYASSSGNADTLDSVHLNGIFTAFGNNNYNITATIGGVTKSFLVNWAADSDKLDGYHANSLLTSVTNTNNGISVTVGGTTKSVSNISVNYAASAGSASSATSAGSASSATQAANLTPENTPHYFRNPSSSSWRGGMYWGNAGNESMSFVAANGGTRFQFVGGSDIANWTSSTWQSVTPYLTINSSGIVTPGSVTATNGFHHVNHDNNDAVLLAGGGYSQGVPVKYWSIEEIYIYGPKAVFGAERGGNYTFVTKVEPRIKGSCVLTLQFPSGYWSGNTIIWAMGGLNRDMSNSMDSAIYATIYQYSESKYYLNLSDDDSLNNGHCQLYFMCL